ncbi:gamma-Glu-putrescine oxidase [Mesorhizobium sanjuanii]|uniref:Gamma-Glu-putrescine oxidase n=1 Tax=Mesorhizobium sanjuanii TaxID=2037900 RepID=A0A2A6FLG5_9HYPH|nr:FAD-binding oxidoreductase [Mesorhizobium sanjuanii]PDQ22575.1 gamma-Glu-putrescine oxidase [Mesorhizobium sanjuanii]
MHHITTSDFKFQPYWWDAAAPTVIEADNPDAEYDVVVVGSGYTGVSAALHLARAGRSVAIFDRQDPGAGASRRNAGFIGRVLKKSYSDLSASKGKGDAKAIYAELHSAYRFTLDLIESEAIACFASRPGRFIGATSKGHFDALAADLGRMQAEMGFDYAMVPAGRQREELGTDLYLGGAVIPDSGCLHPGLYHKGLLDRAMAAGVTVFGRTEVEEIRASSTGSSEIRTTKGVVRARDVVVGTNGYTTNLGWFRRRIVPFRAYMAATEEMPRPLLEKLIPLGRTVVDSNTNIDFFRPAPDSNRILFGGATAAPLGGQDEIVRRMKAILDRVLPDARELRLSHAWSGYCAGTFDLMPHMGSNGRVHYGMGYNFSGITLGTTFGRKIAGRILGEPGVDSMFATSKFPTMPLYSGRPWFLGLVMRYFDWHDRQIARRGT